MNEIFYSSFIAWIFYFPTDKEEKKNLCKKFIFNNAIYVLPMLFRKAGNGIGNTGKIGHYVITYISGCSLSLNSAEKDTAGHYKVCFQYRLMNI